VSRLPSQEGRDLPNVGSCRGHAAGERDARGDYSVKAELTQHSIGLFRGETDMIYAVRPCAAWALACALALPYASFAAEQDATSLAKAIQNPVADLISVPFQYNANFEFGPLEKTQHVLNIQPVYPIKLSSEWNLITRTIVPLLSQPGLVPGQDRENGLGDVQLSCSCPRPKLMASSGAPVWSNRWTRHRTIGSAKASGASAPLRWG
jgi:hypothetical protein